MYPHNHKDSHTYRRGYINKYECVSICCHIDVWEYNARLFLFEYCVNESLCELYIWMCVCMYVYVWIWLSCFISHSLLVCYVCVCFIAAIHSDMDLSWILNICLVPNERERGSKVLFRSSDVRLDCVYLMSITFQYKCVCLCVWVSVCACVDDEGLIVCFLWSRGGNKQIMAM